ncbi:2-hydroxychromene-2-carboxylate isomerase [Ramlibacter ginsenosidimutans]|uniref:2-hydroxychromene-2-carboxylate isomerase n=1 Tax=Ramlibacter ginsenosidimutans TaxID=502333 RepID=A0A934TNS1_9BURK|nr:2-hydroxychromene-2-carboxylate isomerase [Ramlibacter ginsenosidimutans]MBK6004558.1 2-hydroxychromene-2-carboxylate isomerase [Ramlibacter ginsenosidimutans]
MSKAVEFYFDVGSPAAYLAWTQLPQIARAAGAEIEYRPFLLGGVFQATGNRSPMEVPAKGQYMQDDLQRFARRYGVPFARNPHFPINTLTLMRGAIGLQMREPARMVPYVDAVYRAIWVDGKNMNDPATVAKVLQQAGFAPEQLLALASDPAVKDHLKAETQEAVARGVFGAPTFFVGQDMFWGQDRLDFVKERLQT